MILPGTYHNGFAPRDGEPLFPELWRGCVGAWNPGLGPTGLRLYDWSPYKNHGTLTNMPAGDAWKNSQGRHVLDFDGTNDHIILGPANAIYKDPVRISVSAWVNFRAFTRAYNTIIETQDSANQHYQLSALVKSNGKLAFYINNTATSGNTNYDGSGIFTLATNTWYHLAFVFVGGVQQQGFVNGQLDGSVASPHTAITPSANLIAIGNSTFATRNPDCLVDDVRFYSRGLSNYEIRILASHRGIAYKMAPRRWTSQQIAAYRARQYSQIIGGGVI
jgi:hypothetical protein